MPSISIFVDDDIIAVAGEENMTLLSASLCSSEKGVQWLNVSGVGSADKTESEYLTWARRQIAADQVVEFRLTGSNQFSIPDRRETESKIESRMSRLASLSGDHVSIDRVATPKVTCPELYYWIQVNSDSPVAAYLEGHDQLGAELTWNAYKPDFEFSVRSVSVLSDGNTTEKDWLDATVGLNDRIKIIIKQLPRTQAIAAANQVA